MRGGGNLSTMQTKISLPPCPGVTQLGRQFKQLEKGGKGLNIVTGSTHTHSKQELHTGAVKWPDEPSFRWCWTSVIVGVLSSEGTTGVWIGKIRAAWNFGDCRVRCGTIAQWK